MPIVTLHPPLFRASGLLVAVALTTWLPLTACKEDAPSAPVADPAAAGSDLFNSMGDASKKAAPIPAPPSEDPSAGARGPGQAAGEPPLVPALDPAVAAECKGLREQETALRAQADEIREKRVAPASAEFEKASDAFNECQENFACSNDEGRYGALGSAVQKAEAAQEREEEALATVEGQLHDISQSISMKCGDF